tara:strand:+ start:266 stop:496 length:231 start_codon:yes stop_codon:yes gene_type:complete
MEQQVPQVQQDILQVVEVEEMQTQEIQQVEMEVVEDQTHQVVVKQELQILAVAVAVLMHQVHHQVQQEHQVLAEVE